MHVQRCPRPPWFRKSRNSWFVTLGGKQIDLETADKKDAYTNWHQLALNPPATVAAVPRLTARELLARFLEWAEKHTRPASYYWYSYFLKSFAPKLPKELPAADVRPFRVTQWIDARGGWGVNSRRSAIGAVKRAFQWGVQEGYLDFSPLAGMRKPAGKRRETILTVEQRAMILAAVKQRCFRDFLTLMQETGARPQEIRIVEARHVDPENRVWVFPPEEHKTGSKTGRPRVVYLTPAAWTITKRLMAEHPSGALCRNSRGAPWTRTAIRCRFRQLRRKLVGKVPDDLCAYVFRHSFATDALERGVDPMTLAELMGHRDATMISRVYQHLNQRTEHMQAAICRATGQALAQSEAPAG